MIHAAVIGCGRMGAFTSDGVRQYAPRAWFPLAHAEAIVAAEGVSLEALVDPDPDRLSEAAKLYGAGRTYADHTAMLAEGAPDLVGIATRTLGRAAIIADCAAAGTRALHIEKPICNSMAELDDLEALFARDDVFATLGAVRRHFAIYGEAIRRASDGTIGNLFEARVDMGQGALLWTHPHSVDLLLLAAGERELVSVSARLGEVGRDGAVIRNDPVVLQATLEFDDGFVGQFARGFGTDFTLSGSLGSVAVLNDGHALWQSGGGEAGDNPYPEPQRQEFDAGDVPQGALAPILQLVACLNGNETARAANSALKRDILRGQKALFAMVQSHLEGGRAVSLNDIDPAMVIEGRTGQFYA
ncbi:Gfo/Idh/MocA family protein [Erythrobacter sp. JK5]|uniref:Gfo/Idh/MocA family protein n=1 Tax=Erythrobacter sp. JK5 TaxID=2829500 RepID=UPI001BAD303A|nr:Gfo/Idh/MocA family oxidoreductase [Erythrobacter sp. JK5]QUL37334.1 Gfo/Idh/MocA family oxidoreductase [Erythrobacter sp. JK5]